MGLFCHYRVYIGVILGLEGIYWGSIGIMENKLDTTIMGLYWDNGKQDANYYN